MRCNVCPYLTVGDADRLHKSTIILQLFHSAEILASLQAIEDGNNIGSDYACMGPSLCEHVLLRPLDYISQSKDAGVGLELKGGSYVEPGVLENRCSNGRRGSMFEEISVNATRTKGRDLQTRFRGHL